MADQENKQTNEKPQEDENRKRNPWDIRPYFAIGLTTVIIIFIAFALFFFFYRFEGFSSGVSNVISSLYGIIFGLILAYLLNPVMKFFERLLRKKMFTKVAERTRRQNRTIRAFALVIAMACFLAVVTILLVIIVPQLITTVSELVNTLDSQLQTLVDWVVKLAGDNKELAGQIQSIATNIVNAVEQWIETRLSGSDTNFLETVLSGVSSVLRMLIAIIVGIIVTVYVLMTKERFIGQGKKLIYAIFKPKAGNVVVAFFHQADNVFGGFFVGKIIDSVIVGFICLAFMSIAHFPYVALVSVIVGVTNIIPVFGPYIGAIPSIILIFLVDPIYALYFLIFIIVLQQVDGHIIGPRILGNATGLSPFWIIFAILLFGGSFGIVGMIFGVPIFAMIYYVIKRLAEFALHRNDLPEETMDYVNVEHIDPDSHEVTYRESRDDKRMFSAFNPRRNRQTDKKQSDPPEDNPDPPDKKEE